MRPRIAGTAGFNRGLSVRIVSDSISVPQQRRICLTATSVATLLYARARHYRQAAFGTWTFLNGISLGRFRPPDPSIVDRPHCDWKSLLVRSPILEKLSG